MRRMLSGFLVACLAIVATDAKADLVTNPITGTNPNTVSPYTTGQTVAANLTFSGIGRGPGLTGSDASNRYNATGWSTASSLNVGDYFTFTLTPAPGFLLNFIDFEYTSQASGSGPTSFAFRSSVDAFAANIATPISTGGVVSLTALAYQGLSSATEFRLYGWNASAGTGTFSVNDFVFDGTVTAVPEPSSIAVAIIGGIGGVVYRYRRRKAVPVIA